MSYDQKKWLEQIDRVIGQGPYEATWESLSKHKTPDWFMDAKFGIFIHWGVYSVPAFGNEWYSRSMYLEWKPEFEHHIKPMDLKKSLAIKILSRFSEQNTSMRLHGWICFKKQVRDMWSLSQNIMTASRCIEANFLTGMRSKWDRKGMCSVN